MDDIKPLAKLTAIDDGFGTVFLEWLEKRPEAGTKLYPESALSQAREEGRQEGVKWMRDKLPAKMPDHEWSGDYPSDDSYQDGYANGWNDALTRAAEGK
jgi:hypothetical protein